MALLLFLSIFVTDIVGFSWVFFFKYIPIIISDLHLEMTSEESLLRSCPVKFSLIMMTMGMMYKLSHYESLQFDIGFADHDHPFNITLSF